MDREHAAPRDDAGEAGPSAERDSHDEPSRRVPARPRDDVDETSAESFPASDPPSWTGLRVGAPKPAGWQSRREPE